MLEKFFGLKQADAQSGTARFFDLKHADSLSDVLLWQIFTYLTFDDLLPVSKLVEFNDEDKNSKEYRASVYWSMVAQAMIALHLMGRDSSTTSAIRLSGGMTNATWNVHFFNEKTKKVLRVPGKGSSAFVNRMAEYHNAQIAGKLGLNVPLAYSDPDGFQLSDYVTNPQTLSTRLLENELVLKRVALKMKTLHTSKEPFYSNLDPFKVNDELIKGLKGKSFDFGVDINPVIGKMEELKQLFSSYEIKLSPCHNDPTPGNFILSLQNGEEPDENTPLYQTDWEYSNMNDLMWDLAYFSELAKLTPKQQEILLSTYFEAQFKDEHLKQIIVSWFTVYKSILQWWITLWSWMQLANQANAVDRTEYEVLARDSFNITQTHLNSAEHQRAVAFIHSERTELESSVALRPF